MLRKLLSVVLLINALIFSHLNYCSSIRGKRSAKQLNEVRTKMCQLLRQKLHATGNICSSNEIMSPPPLKDLKWIIFNSILRSNEASYMCTNLNFETDSNVKKINFALRNKVLH